MNSVAKALLHKPVQSLADWVVEFALQLSKLRLET